MESLAVEYPDTVSSKDCMELMTRGERTYMNRTRWIGMRSHVNCCFHFTTLTKDHSYPLETFRAPAAVSGVAVNVRTQLLIHCGARLRIWQSSSLRKRTRDTNS